ncbi:molybdopterin-guanine dinucleotide biosynthesis protein B [Roseateles hydrophilus]|nr:molybdopterin-guanine dinucleotide biosynthesis protein B [Pelomonas sp. UHG3]
MKVFGIAGRSGMGKTTLLERLIPALVARGLSVSILKHSHKDIEVDRPGKDSHRLREAGCQEVLLLGRTRWALMHELRDQAEPTLQELLPRIQSCDLLLVEGFKSGDFPKLEVWRAEVGKPLLWPDFPGIVAVASDTQPPAEAPRWLDLRDTQRLVELMLSEAHDTAELTPREGLQNLSSIRLVRGLSVGDDDGHGSDHARP